jgi:hypothetical protein
MEKPDMDVIDKLFNCLHEFYGNRWTSQFRDGTEPLHKTMWQSALYGCTYEQIRGVLVYLKRAAQNPNAKPPHQLEFYRYISANKTPDIDYKEPPKSSSKEAARKALDEINSKLRYRRPENGDVLRETA